MKLWKKMLILLAAVICAAVLFIFYYKSTHVFVDGHVYSADAKYLDLRGTGISLQQYEAIHQALPECDIDWDIPFQGNFYPEDTTVLSIRSLRQEDFRTLTCFPYLETLDASECKDYDALTQLSEVLPQVEILYNVTIGGKEWPQSAQELTVSSLSDSDVDMLRYLPEVSRIDAGNCGDLEILKSIGLQHPHIEISYNLTFAGETFDRFSREITFIRADIGQLESLLWHMPNLERLELICPEGNPADLPVLSELHPDLAISWNREVLGINLTSIDTEVDLSDKEPGSLEQLREELAWFPNVELVYFGTPQFDNETMAAFREEMRSEYKVVWNVEVGYLTLRTDDTYYMPGKYNLGVTEEQSYNLRYCEDMVCIDVGHKPLYSCTWAAFMPNLKYLIIADTAISDISPLKGLDQLIYLEMFITPVKDLSPLLSCTALEDLNLSYVRANPKPVTQMTWLNNLWWADSPMEVDEFQEYLPDTHLMFLHHSSTHNGWRQLQNYYDMRDYLGMPYMLG